MIYDFQQILTNWETMSIVVSVTYLRLCTKRSECGEIFQSCKKNKSSSIAVVLKKGCSSIVQSPTVWLKLLKSAKCMLSRHGECGMILERYML